MWTIYKTPRKENVWFSNVLLMTSRILLLFTSSLLPDNKILYNHIYCNNLHFLFGKFRCIQSGQIAPITSLLVETSKVMWLFPIIIWIRILWNFSVIISLTLLPLNPICILNYFWLHCHWLYYHHSYFKFPLYLKNMHWRLMIKLSYGSEENIR